MNLLLLGDLCPTEMTRELYEEGDIDTLFTDTLELFDANDVKILNLECAITESTNAIKKFGPNLSAVPNTAMVIK